MLGGSGAGELRSRVRFDKPALGDDGYGNPIQGWQEMFTVSSQNIPKLGGEAVAAAQLAGRQPYILRIRQSPDTKQIRTDWRATWLVPNPRNEDTVMNIRTIADPDSGSGNHGLWLELIAETGVAV